MYSKILWLSAALGIISQGLDQDSDSELVAVTTELG